MTNRIGHAGRRSDAGPDITSLLIPIFIYLFSIALYVHPLTSAPTPSENQNDSTHRWHLVYLPKPQLDETHIMTAEHHDVSPAGPDSSWRDAWHNDYWGRPLDSESSHKSWRPVSVWSFRFMKGGMIGRWWFAVLGRFIGGSVECILSLFGRGFRQRGERTDPFHMIDYLASELFVHRFVNVMIHAALVQLVGAVAALLFRNNPPPSSENVKSRNLQLYTQYISQILFAVHPVHVEAVVNVANRPHILALLFNATIVDPDVPLLAVALLATLGLLTAETAIFQFPAIVLTMTAIRYRERIEANDREKSSSRKSSSSTSRGEEKKTQQKPPFLTTFTALLPRYALLALISTTYLAYRHYNDTLSIPIGLIRPAENPFYNKLDKNEWSLGSRIRNYSYILSLHVLKSFGVEVVGFSHEYGFDCIPEITSWVDPRLLLPASLLFLLEGLAAWSWYGGRATSRGDGRQTRRRRREREERAHRALLALVFFSWMATLFPIAGILKVGTFVADRVAVAASFGACVFAGRLLAVWMASSGHAPEEGAERGANGSDARIPVRRRLNAVAAFCLCAAALAHRTHGRAAAWMDSVPLFESSLAACPQSIKSNLEMSKLYSGLVPQLLDLEKALSLIRKAESIDPTYCDVHQQYSHVYFQQQKYLPFEEEMAQSLRCPFTMGQAMSNWNRYWKVVLRGGRDPEARRRYDGYMATIQDEIQAAEAAGGTHMIDARGGGVEEEL